MGVQWGFIPLDLFFLPVTIVFQGFAGTKTLKPYKIRCNCVLLNILNGVKVIWCKGYTYKKI